MQSRGMVGGGFPPGETNFMPQHGGSSGVDKPDGAPTLVFLFASETRHPPNKMRRCPGCGLPTPSDLLGLAFAATDDHHTAHGVCAICSRCQQVARRLPPSARMRMFSRAADRGLAEPSRYWCALFPSTESARLMAALMQHPEHAAGALDACGWVTEDIDQQN